MRKSVRIFTLGVCISLAAACVACSTDSVVWGAEGAQVRAVTEQVIDDIEASGETSKVCTDAAVELGSSTAWEGLAAGEPEEYTGDQWEDFADLSPTWVINLSPTHTEHVEGVQEVPVYLFYRGSGEDLCVVGIEWGELATSP